MKSFCAGFGIKSDQEFSFHVIEYLKWIFPQFIWSLKESYNNMFNNKFKNCAECPIFFLFCWVWEKSHVSRSPKTWGTKGLDRLEKCAPFIVFLKLAVFRVAAMYLSTGITKNAWPCRSLMSLYPLANYLLPACTSNPPL